MTEQNEAKYDPSVLRRDLDEVRDALFNGETGLKQVATRHDERIGSVYRKVCDLDGRIKFLAWAFVIASVAQIGLLGTLIAKLGSG